MKLLVNKYFCPKTAICKHCGSLVLLEGFCDFLLLGNGKIKFRCPACHEESINKETELLEYKE